MLAEFTAEELSQALDAVADDIRQAAGVSGPPVDAMAVAQRLNIAVAWNDRQRGRASRVKLHDGLGGEQTSILLRPEPRAERRQWAVAHEIGETYAVGVFARLGAAADEAPHAREQVANQLASRLLLPRDEFLLVAQESRWDLLELKAAFTTASHELIARRMLDFAASVVVSVLDQGQLTWRRSNVPGRTPPMNPLEQRAWRAVHDGPKKSVKLRDVQAWAIHEAQWRREIVRLEIVDEF